MSDDADKPEIPDPEIVAIVQKILEEVKSAETNNVTRIRPPTRIYKWHDKTSRYSNVTRMIEVVKTSCRLVILWGVLTLLWYLLILVWYEIGKGV